MLFGGLTHLIAFGILGVRGDLCPVSISEPYVEIRDGRILVKAEKLLWVNKKYGPRRAMPFT